jgi:hypothetical protein
VFHFGVHFWYVYLHEALQLEAKGLH